MSLRATAKHKFATMDGNEAAASVAYRTNEICAIYPITPSSNMGEFADQWASEGEVNIWGTQPDVVEMQSEGGASGAVHGALQSGSLTTTFTASQGLLLMTPNMFKIAGELTSTVFHIAARSVATSSLSIFGDHSDVMSTRGTGWGFLASSSVQEAHDMAAIAQLATLDTRVPFLHFFDGFRTSHEVNKMALLSDDELRALIPDELVFAHRARALSPDRPFIRGTAQNPDVCFQAREAVNPFYAAAPAKVEKAMARFAEITGRKYKLFDYFGHPQAERVLIIMGSGTEAARELVDVLVAKGEKIGVLQVHLYRPFSASHFLGALPKTARLIAVLDRTKEPGSAGEPLYQDIVTCLSESVAEGTIAAMPRIIGGRYGLSSKEFTPAMVKSVFDELSKSKPKNHFTVGIEDDVSHTSLTYDPHFVTESKRSVRGQFFGLGADGTVSANKNSIKIIGEETENYAQGYFVYDSKKSGTMTVSHLRFGPDPIRSTYCLQSATFVACSQFGFLEKVDILECAEPGAMVLLNSPYGADVVWDHLPRPMQAKLIEKGNKLYVINADKVARDLGLGGRTNTVMQTCFFALSGVLPRDEAIAKIKEAIDKTYRGKGEHIVKKNWAAVDGSLANMHEVEVPKAVSSKLEMLPPVSADAPEFVRNVLGKIIAFKGDSLPVSALPADGTYPSGTTAYEKRNIAPFIPIWDEKICIQ
jgi:pyruvate-ferredoxin/flavodoxin oxidoreductase